MENKHYISQHCYSWTTMPNMKHVIWKSKMPKLEKHLNKVCEVSVFTHEMLFQKNDLKTTIMEAEHPAGAPVWSASKAGWSCSLPRDWNQPVATKSSSVVKLRTSTSVCSGCSGSLVHRCCGRGRPLVCSGEWELTSGTKEAPAHVDGGGEEAVPLGAAMAAADHDVMCEGDAACSHAAVSCVVGHRTADTTHQTT